MARTLALPIAAAVVIAGYLASGGRPDSANAWRPGGKPNIVVVMTDDQDFRSVRRMKAVRRLVGRPGTTFRNSYATYPLCCPSRATFHTGLYSHNHGVLSGDPGKGGGYQVFVRNVPAKRTVAVRLNRRGYMTGFTGKYLNGYGIGSPTEVPAGWDRWAALTGHSEYRMWGYSVNRNGRVARYGWSTADYQTDVLGRTAADMIRAGHRADRPFFVVLSTVAPHTESETVLGPGARRNPRPAPRHRGRFERKDLPRVPSFNEKDIDDKPRFFRREHRRRLSAGRIGEIRRLYRSRMESLLAVDDAVARLGRTLRETGELRKTVFVFTSDNGFLLGEHREYGKELAYEESARVPLLIRGPGFPRGATRTQIVGNVDLAPTFMDLAGASAHRMDGVSLLPLAANPNARRNRPILIERARVEGRAYAAIRQGRWKYVKHGGGSSELYDLSRDPHELENLARLRRHAAVRRALSKRLRKLDHCRRDACR